MQTNRQNVTPNANDTGPVSWRGDTARYAEGKAVTPTAEQVISIARQFLFVREATALGPNRGQRVESIQHWSGGQPSDSWCCHFATMVLDIAYQGLAPLPRGGSCQNLYELAQRMGLVKTSPAVGDLYLYVNDSNHAHHVGLVTATAPLVGIAGNTSADGSSDNGDRVAEHKISAHVFVRYL